MEFKKATIEMIDEILNIYSESRDFMRKSGNKNQWSGGYPQKELVFSDINAGNLVVLTENGIILAVFLLASGPDKTYTVIKDGKWINDEPYGVIHRIAVKEKGKGLSSLCFDYAYDKYKNIRIDTHRDNIPMQKALEKNGFKKCGIIFLENGDERIAFQKV